MVDCGVVLDRGAYIGRLVPESLICAVSHEPRVQMTGHRYRDFEASFYSVVSLLQARGAFHAGWRFCRNSLISDGADQGQGSKALKDVQIVLGRSRKSRLPIGLL